MCWPVFRCQHSSLMVALRLVIGTPTPSNRGRCALATPVQSDLPSDRFHEPASHQPLHPPENPYHRNGGCADAYFQLQSGQLAGAGPFLFVWVFNTIDAVLLSWCAILKRDAAYSLLNLFWILVGVVGIVRAWPPAH